MKTKVARKLAVAKNASAGPDPAKEVINLAEQVEKLQADLELANKTAFGNANVALQVSNIANQNHDAARYYEKSAAVRQQVISQKVAKINTMKMLDRRVVESLLQERMELVGRLMRVDQRLDVLGYQPPQGRNAFALLGV